jgi:hypothetical protein
MRNIRDYLGVIGVSVSTYFRINALYPPVCLLCGGQGDRGLDLCDACFRELP